MDIEVILDAAEASTPGLQALAQHFLEAEAWYLGVPLDVASAMERRAGGVPEVHITGAADQLLGHLVTTEPGVLHGDSTLMALARIGACAMVGRIEMDQLTGASASAS